MDGNLRAAAPSVKKAIDKNRTDLCLVFGSSLDSSSIMRRKQAVKETRHDLTKREFTIHHVFLAV